MVGIAHTHTHTPHTPGFCALDHTQAHVYSWATPNRAPTTVPCGWATQNRAPTTFPCRVLRPRAVGPHRIVLPPQSRAVCCCLSCLSCRSGLEPWGARVWGRARSRSTPPVVVVVSLPCVYRCLVAGIAVVVVRIVLPPPQSRAVGPQPQRESGCSLHSPRGARRVPCVCCCVVSRPVRLCLPCAECVLLC